MHRYLIVIEPTDSGYSAYSPDLPGCIATGRSLAAVSRAMREAMAFHVDGLKAEGLPLPPGGATASYVEIAA